jgi:hypothetical protein
MTTRRLFLRLALGAAALAVLAPGLGRLGRLAPRTRAPGLHLVNGWILTDADLQALEKHI